MKKLTLTLFAGSLLVSTAFATNVAVYEKPENQTKSLTQVATEKLVQIIEKDGWVKVGNKENGDIGWVKSTELAKQVTNGQNNSFYQQTVIIGHTDKDGKMNYKVYQSDQDNSQTMTQQQAEELFKHIQWQQKQMAEQMNRMMQYSFADLPQVFMHRHTKTVELKVIDVANATKTSARDAVNKTTASATQLTAQQLAEKK